MQAFQEMIAGPLRFDLLVRLLLAAALGGVIGLEREISGKPAGLRTNLLICVGAALLTDLSVAIAEAAGLGTQADPARIAAQIVSGIGFLGAGTIIQSRGSVTGLTTAATLWVVAAIGMAAGAGAYIEAVGTTGLVVVALIVLGRVEERYLSRGEHKLELMVEGTDVVERLEAILAEERLRFDALEVSRESGAIRITLVALGRHRSWKAVVPRLLQVPGVRQVKRA